MKKLLSILPMLAFLFGLTAAVAHQTSETTEVAKRFAQTAPDVWEDITGDQIGEDYMCNLTVETECTRAFDAAGKPLPKENQQGEYIPL